MSDHAILGLIAVIGFAIQITGLMLMIVIVRQSHRESQRMTRAVADLVHQESEKIRALFDR
jgi:hypothetical protein